MENVKYLSSGMCRLKTIDGRHCKMYLKLMGDGENLGLLICKLILTKKHDHVTEEFKLLKQFNDYGLYRQIFSVKTDTLFGITKWTMMALENHTSNKPCTPPK